MERTICIRDYKSRTTQISIKDFERVGRIDVKVISGDEILTIIYDDFHRKTFDALTTGYRFEGYDDGSFCIYIKGEKDIINAFSARSTSYDDFDGEYD